MKQFRLFLLFLCMAAVGPEAAAQFSITKVAPVEVDTRAIRDTLSRDIDIDGGYFSQSRIKAEQRRVRKERNTVTATASLQLTQTGFHNWAAGGDNIFAGRATLAYAHNYKKGKFNFNYSLDARYGINFIDGVQFKNEDMFRLNVNPSWDLSKNWSYAALAQFSSQFSRGYRSRTDQTLVSDLMAPGTLTLGIGFTYRHQKLPFYVNISPLSGNMTFVLNEELSQQGLYGVDPGSKTKSALGSALILDLKVPIAKERLKYSTYLDVFSNYKEITRVNWDNGIDIQVLKFITVNLFCSTKFDSTYNFWKQPDGYVGVERFERKIQLKYALSLGFSYTFKNK